MTTRTDGSGVSVSDLLLDADRQITDLQSQLDAKDKLLGMDRMKLQIILKEKE